MKSQAHENLICTCKGEREQKSTIDGTQSWLDTIIQHACNVILTSNKYCFVGDPRIQYTCRRPSRLRGMVTQPVGVAPLVVMAFSNS